MPGMPFFSLRLIKMKYPINKLTTKRKLYCAMQVNLDVFVKPAQLFS